MTDLYKDVRRGFWERLFSLSPLTPIKRVRDYEGELSRHRDLSRQWFALRDEERREMQRNANLATANRTARVERKRPGLTGAAGMTETPRRRSYDSIMDVVIPDAPILSMLCEQSAPARAFESGGGGDFGGAGSTSRWGGDSYSPASTSSSSDSSCSSSSDSGSSDSGSCSSSD